MGLFNNEPSDNFIDGYARHHRMGEGSVRDLINDSTDWRQTLDNTAFNRAKEGISTGKDYSKLFLDDLDTSGMRNMNPKEIVDYNTLVGRDRAKDLGTDLRGFGAESGYGSSVKQARQASIGTKMKAFGETLNPLGRSNINSFQESFGFVSKENHLMASKGSLFQKMTRKAMIPGFTALTAFSALQSDEDSLNSFLTMSVGTWGLQQGWRQGKAGADALLGKAAHWKRIPIASVTSLGLGALAAGATWAVNDLGKNDSAIAKSVKRIYSKEQFTSTKATQESLTMRRAALSKLSASSLNNRGQLLGNEASILRSAQY